MRLRCIVNCDGVSEASEQPVPQQKNYCALFDLSTNQEVKWFLDVLKFTSRLFQELILQKEVRQFGEVATD